MSTNPNIQAPTRKEALVIRLMILLGCLSIVNFAYWFTREEFRANGLLYGLLSFTLLYGILKTMYLWYHYLKISVPETPALTQDFSVDILTTYFPGEPYEMIEETLQAIQKISYPHTTYLCDEANDPHLIEFCQKLNVVHVTRDNRINAKAGNINNALKMATGEICVILDPDHVPQPNFLDPILPHFTNPEIGFVQIVQSYYNNRETLVARGAAEQTYQFYGPMMMTMNTYGTVNAIGANCTFRRSALESIGGHAPGLSEDMHTAMCLHAKGWKSVYVPRILARGLVPSDLTSFYKQQLKWSRGTFDLLFYVYPRLFRQFSWRQKLHYGLLPLHFLVGTIYLINFLIPIISLISAKMPWSGNIMFFGLFYLPLGMSTLLIRAYIQKWVMEKNERGFHLMGGLLQITTWWIYFLGFVYTIFKKKIPYLPTPKNGDVGSNYKVIFPNVVIGSLSVFAVIYGLYIDFTPFSIAMSFFALLNAFFMFFSIFLATTQTNKNNILRTTLPRETVSKLVVVKSWYRKMSDRIFHMVRPLALPLLLVAFTTCTLFLVRYKESKWEAVQLKAQPALNTYYLGIFQPTANDGISDLDAIRQLEAGGNARFNLVSMYLAWGDTTSLQDFQHKIAEIHRQKRLPMITWEPWGSTFKASDSISGLSKEKKVLSHIANGAFDDYIRGFASYLASLEAPVFLRFAHEFDNPAYPWSHSGDNNPEDLLNAWRHVHHIFREQGAVEVVWVWNPWKPACMQQYYPGDEFVDWVGITSLDYATLNNGEESLSFREVYAPYHEALNNFNKKPVLLTEFGTLATKDGRKWVSQAFNDISQHFKEVKGLVFFNSAYDTNIPDGERPVSDTLNWRLNQIPDIPEGFLNPIPAYLFGAPPVSSPKNPQSQAKLALELPAFRGTSYIKGQNWYKNHYVLDKDVLQGDLGMMKEAGLDVLLYRGSGVYDQNIMKYSGEAGMRLIYSLWMPASVNYVEDAEEKKWLKENILRSVKANMGADQLIAWNLGNDVWQELGSVYSEPVLSYQRLAFLNWLKDVSASIRQLDEERPILLDMVLTPSAISLIDTYRQAGVMADFYLVELTPKSPVAEFIHQAQSKDIGYVLSDPDLTTIGETDPSITRRIILGTWQDPWESDFVGFNGLLNFNGAKKDSYFAVKQNAWDNSRPKARILKPAALLYPGDSYVYRAVLQDKGEWIFPGSEMDEQFSWYLVKKDPYGNYLAFKEIGKGINLSVPIPENYERHELLLNYSENGMVYPVRTELSTPLNAPSPGCY